MSSQHDALFREQSSPGAGIASQGASVQDLRLFPVVGIGASAGGLDAFKALLTALPADTGMAFVLIQHLDPIHPSLMAELLANQTAMPVAQAAEGVSIEPNRVYLIPPGVFLAVANGKLRLSGLKERHGARVAFDVFLTSLAEEYRERAVCIVLSGTGSDGSEGLKAVKSKGGLVIVQEPSETAFDGMPKSAIQTGLVDLILPVAKIPAALIERMARIGSAAPDLEAGPDPEHRYRDILDLVRLQTRQDFSLYKSGTLTRRIERRMAMAAITETARYIEKLKAEPSEVESLAHDLLINVTQFFRDAAAFEALAVSAIPELIAGHSSEMQLRVWVPGCSTGEEAYSLAILFMEAIRASKLNIRLQVFASDVDPHSIAFARAGIYGPETEAQVGGGRLNCFFSKEAGGFRVIRELREAVVFTVQDLLADPPFSRLDLISCRNVLIYLQPPAQEQVLSLFHFALRAGGVLFLGRSETTGKFAERFEAIDKKQRIYRHLGTGRPDEPDFRPAGTIRERLAPAIAPAFRRVVQRANLADIASKHLLDEFAPPSVLVDKKYECLYFSGAVDPYLRVASGEASRNILVMARDGLRPNLRAALEAARNSSKIALKTGALVHRGETALGVKIAVQPIASEDMLLVSFIEEPARTLPPLGANAPPEDISRIVELEQELDATRKELNATIRDLEISNEDLRAVNEEALSVNEEFQSTNEELETSKEELQSLNEELTALNGQLQETLEHQRSTAADLQNILDSSDVATLFLDTALNIRFFTPASKVLFGLTSVDIGRPLIDLAKRFHDDALMPDAFSVLSKLEPMRREIESEDGNWYIRSIMPYRSEGSVVGGVVITFARISEMKAAEREIDAAKAYAESIIATVGQPLVVLDEELRLVSASASFYNFFGLKPQECIGKPLEIADALQIAPLAKTSQNGERGTGFGDWETTVDLPALGLRTLRLGARRILPGTSGRKKILVSIDDITDAKAKAEALAVAKEEAERANLAKSRFLAAASHDLRQPLQTMNLLQGMLIDSVSDPGCLKLLDRLDTTVVSMSGLLDKLLDINQLEAGVVQPKIVDFVIGEVIEQLRAEFEIHAANEGLTLHAVPCGLTVRSDPRLLEQILRNLLSNATKYTRHGKVLIGCRRHKDSLSIEVWDTGTGIPETELSAIFKEFHQLENHSGKRSKGLGLGLAIVQRLSELLDAPITVRSRVGRGSAFAVEVPLAPAASRVEPPLGVAAPLEGKGAGPTLSEQAHSILIVEDDTELRETLKMLLDKRGYRCLAARDGDQALILAASIGASLDLIVADYNLPGPNGLDVVEKIEKSAGRKIPAILLTGDISAATLREIAEKSHIHLYKPVDSRSLIGKVQGSLTARKPTQAPTIFVVDDAREIRETMRDMLEKHGYRAEIFADSASFLRAYSPDRPGCLLADARLPGMGGLQLIEHLTEMQSSLPVIIITAYGDVAMAVTAMKAGAFDFLQKPVRQDQLLESIQRALMDSSEHPPTAERAHAATKIETLTARQREILDLVLQGKASKVIAAELEISQRTVDSHRAAIMRKVGAKSLSGLIRVALAAV